MQRYKKKLIYANNFCVFYKKVEFNSQYYYLLFNKKATLTYIYIISNPIHHLTIRLCLMYLIVIFYCSSLVHLSFVSALMYSIFALQTRAAHLFRMSTGHSAVRLNRFTIIARWIILWRRLRIFVIGAEEPLWMAVRSDIALPGCPTYPIEASLSVPRFLPYTIVIQAVTLHPVASHSAPTNADTTPFDPCTAL